MKRGERMRRVSRRAALRGLGAGAIGLVWPAGRSWSLNAQQGIEELSERLQRAPAAAAFDITSDAIRAGAKPGTVLGAIFLCGVRDVRPRPHGILHSVMIVESCCRLGEASAPVEAWLPVFWNLDDMKRSQERDRMEGDWVLGRAAQPRGSSATEARREFVAAMEAWDVERADRAVVGLVRSHAHAEAFETIWPLAARCYAFIGHKMIYAAQVERMLRRIGWEHAEAALRSLVMSALVDRDTATLGLSRELAAGLPADWDKGREDPAHSAALAGVLRSSGPAQAQRLVAQAFQEGRGPHTVWDALRLVGAELFARRTGRSAADGRAALLPVHAFTVTAAFRHAFDSSTRDETRRVLVLQAAGWLASLRDDLARIVGLQAERASGYAADVARANVSTMRSRLFRTAQEHHQFKYLAALEEEGDLVHPRWAGQLALTAEEYVANPSDAETEVYRRSVAALRRAGLSLPG
jgi:hypothetical protein